MSNISKQAIKLHGVLSHENAAKEVCDLKKVMTLQWPCRRAHEVEEEGKEGEDGGRMKERRAWVPHSYHITSIH